MFPQILMNVLWKLTGVHRTATIPSVHTLAAVTLATDSTAMVTDVMVNKLSATISFGFIKIDAPSLCTCYAKRRRVYLNKVVNFSTHDFPLLSLQILTSVLKALTGVFRTATTMLARTLVAVILATD